MPLVDLDLRGARLRVARGELMELPESVLLCLFPNGVVLSPQRNRGEADDRETAEVYYVDFDAQCLDFVLAFFGTARLAFYGPAEGPPRELADSFAPNQANLQNPLFHKQAIIVLREELEYFAIPPKSGLAVLPATDSLGLPNDELLKLKVDCGNALLARTSIFTALQRNVNRENNVAEQHLIDMLCMSGFEREDTWGYRSLEPNRCCITSIALVLLKTGIVHPPLPSIAPATLPPSATPDEITANGIKPSVRVNAQQLATAQKLLLFWRKPARKCWWDATELVLSEATPDAHEIKVWARRVWTLELSLI